MSLNTSFEQVTLDLEFPFTIARGTTEQTAVVLVRIENDEHVGIGAAAPSRHYGETPETVVAVLPELLSVVTAVDDPFSLQRIERQMRERVSRNPAARSAVSIALHDLVSKTVSQPLYRYLGLDPAESVRTSYTIGIDEPDRMAEKTRTANQRGYTVLKVKLGTDRDIDRLAAVREASPDAIIRVDANEAWTPREAVDRIEDMARYGVEFVEQPVPATNPDGLQFVYEHSKLPIAADESCVTLEDIPNIAGRCDIANLKLMKCGGIREAIRMIHAARANGLEVMLGCMSESNASIAAGCHLTPLVDYADLDGSLLLETDPFAGVPISGGDIKLASSDRSGTGATVRS